MEHTHLSTFISRIHVDFHSYATDTVFTRNADSAVLACAVNNSNSLLSKVLLECRPTINAGHLVSTWYIVALIDKTVMLTKCSLI